MKIKYECKSGKRTVKTCQHCDSMFETLLIKEREGGEKFCSSDCYQNSRKTSDEHKKERNKIHQKKYKYNLSEEDFNTLILKSKNKCQICNTEFKNTTRYNSPCVDHCHDTGIVRGILCHRCNTAIGLLGDKTENVEAALNYLNKTAS